MKTIKTIIVSLITISVFVLLGYYLGYHKGEKHATSSFTEDVVRSTYTDTIPFYVPVPKDSVVIKYKVVKLPVADNRNDKPSTSAAEDSLSEKTDTANVIIPIEQKVYSDSCYTAYVSGFRPSLDSLIFHPRVETVIINRRMKPKRWSVGLQTGYGISLRQTPQLTPYIGIGVSYNLFSF